MKRPSCCGKIFPFLLLTTILPPTTSFLLPPPPSLLFLRKSTTATNPCCHEGCKNHRSSSLMMLQEKQEQQQQQQQVNLETDVRRQQLQEAQQLLDQIQQLETMLLQEQQEQQPPSINTDDDAISSTINNSSSLSVSNINEKLVELARKVDRLTFAPSGLDLPSYLQAIRFYLQSSYTVRYAICRALDLPPENANDWQQAPTIVTQLYQLFHNYQQPPSSPETERFLQKLRNGLIDVHEQQLLMRSSSKSTSLKSTSKSIMKQLLSQLGPLISPTDGSNNTSKLLELDDESTTYQSFLGEVTRKEGYPRPSPQDLQTILSVLDAKTFEVSQVQTIAGGYVLRGRTSKQTGAALLQAIDAKLSYVMSQSSSDQDSSSISQVAISYMPDYFVEVEDISLVQTDPVLVVLNKDFSPSTPLLLSWLSTTLAMGTTILFAFGVFTANDDIAQRLAAMNENTIDSSSLDWFNNMLLGDLIVPILVIQVAHEFGHRLIAWRDKIQIALPTLLPFWQLPLLGAWTPILSSPKNRSSLWDFAVMGPLMGMIASTIFLLVGLQATTHSLPEVVQNFPALPVNILRYSTLVGTFVDYWLGNGATGYVLLQDPTTLIPLHPYAICGFAGLMMNALELLPLGSTDGGRMSQAAFGRIIHVVVGGTAWIILLGTLAFVDHHEMLLGALVIYGLTQSDMEVPCRDETEPVDLVRGFAAIAMWILAIFIIVPIASQ